VQEIVGDPEASPLALAADAVRGVALVRTPRAGNVASWVWQAPPSVSPRYAIVVTGGRGGHTLQPVFVSRFDRASDSRWERPLLVLGGVSAQPGALLFSLDGRLLGMVVAHDEEPIAAPPDALRAAADQLAQGAVPPAGDLGVRLSPLTPALSAAAGAKYGVVVSDIDRAGPAAGQVRVGDVITAVNGRPVYSTRGASVRIARLAAGAEAALSIVRRGAPMDVRLAARAAVPAAPGPPPSDLGLTLRAAPGVGAEVISVSPRSAGAHAGIHPGDFITQVDEQEAPTPAQVRELGGADPLDEALEPTRGPLATRLDMLLRSRAALGLRPGAAPAVLFTPLGVLLGPQALGWLSSSALQQLTVATPAALAALGVFVGLGVDLRRPLDRRLFAAASVEALITVGIVAAAVGFLIERWGMPLGVDPFIVALVLGICAAASSAGGAEVEGGDAHRVATRIADLDDVAPVLLGGAALSLLQAPTIVDAMQLTAVNVGVGLTIGAAGWLLFERAHDAPELGVFVLGALLLLGGAAAYLTLSPLLAGLAAGILWRRLPGRADVILRAELQRFQHPLVALILILAGALLQIDMAALWLCAPFVVFRLAGKVAGGWAASLIARGVAPADLGAYLVHPGVIGLAFALAFDIAAPGEDAGAALSAVVLGTLASEALAVAALPVQTSRPRPADAA
jgi:hypothetical protein